MYCRKYVKYKYQFFPPNLSPKYLYSTKVFEFPLYKSIDKKATRFISSSSFHYLNLIFTLLRPVDVALYSSSAAIDNISDLSLNWLQKP